MKFNFNNQVLSLTMILMCVCAAVSLCYKRSGPHRPRWDRASDRLELDTSSTECLNNECGTTVSGSGSQPTTPHMLPSFNTPGRTSSIHRQSVPLSSFPKSVHDCGMVVKYRTYSSGGSYVGIPPPGDTGSAEFSTVPIGNMSLSFELIKS